MGPRSRALVTACVVALALVWSAGSTSDTRAGGVPATATVLASVGAAPLPAIAPPGSLPGLLSGERLPRARALQRPLAVIVDNYAPDARPQSGLSAASMVIETLAEGGITRFMALYLEQDAHRVGPVRSSRMYFDHWAAAFHAILVHVGGNDDAQDLLWHMPPVFNLDETPWETPPSTSPANPFWLRPDREAPYWVYVDTYKARGYAASLHQDWTYLGMAVPHKAPAATAQRGRSGSLSISFVDPLESFIPANPDYSVRYDFDPASDTYLRREGGKPQIDAATGKPLRAANVVVMRVGAATADPAAGPTFESILIPTIGSGPAWFFRDGRVVAGAWQQRDPFAPLRFLDARGRPVALNPGQTWVEVLPEYSSATWTFQ